MAATPGFPQLPAINILYRDYYLPPIIFGDTTLVHLKSTVYGDYTIGRLKPCNATLLILKKNSARTAKTTPWPLLRPRRSQCSCGARRDKFLAKVHGQCPDAASGTAYELYRRAVRLCKNSNVLFIT